MAKIKPICLAPDCGKPSYSRGYCIPHYGRFRRHGDPLGGGPTRSESGSLLEFLESALSSNTDNCIVWPFANIKGYGHIKIDGEQHYAHRWVCRRSHGEPPAPSHEAAHLCGNSSCVNPKHVAWKTSAENHADKLIHGTHHRGERCPTVKLTERQVREIRSLEGVKTKQQIADMFGVTSANIGMIFRRERWAWLD